MISYMTSELECVFVCEMYTATSLYLSLSLSLSTHMHTDGTLNTHK